MKFRAFTEDEHQTWNALYENLDESRPLQAHPIFIEGLKKLGITAERIPDISEVNMKLMALTGWQAVPAEGLVDGYNFFKGLSERKFPVGNFIRSHDDLNYTPAPDVFHDLYGHIPFFVDKKFADFCQRFGESALKYATDDEKLKEYERLFWFGVEFPLIKTDQGVRIFGGGILSSYGESFYSLSSSPLVEDFSVANIRQKEYRIDIMQEHLYLLSSEDELYQCIDEIESYYKVPNTGKMSANSLHSAAT